MFEEKLEEANDILDKAVCILMKESYVNFLLHTNEMSQPELPNDEELLLDLMDIQTSILKLQYRFKDLAVG